MKLILASGSERRDHLLSWLKVPFDVVVSDFDEESVYEVEPEKLVKRLAYEKARTVATELGDGLVIGADTIVYLEDEVIGKPRDKKDAFKILRKLSGSKHLVYTGVCVFNAATGSVEKAVEKTMVEFRNLSDKDIRDYVATGEPMDKGGAYAIQMGAAGFVKKVEGSYTNVVGLPLLLLTKLLGKQGYNVEGDVSKMVFEKTGFRREEFDLKMFKE